MGTCEECGPVHPEDDGTCPYCGGPVENHEAEEWEDNGFRVTHPDEDDPREL